MSQAETSISAPAKNKYHLIAGYLLLIIYELAVVAAVLNGVISFLSSTPTADPNGSAFRLGQLSGTLFAGGLFAWGIYRIFKGIKLHQRGGRIGGLILSVILLLGFPIGTIIGLATLYPLIFKWGDEPGAGVQNQPQSPTLPQD